MTTAPEPVAGEAAQGFDSVAVNVAQSQGVQIGDHNVLHASYQYFSGWAPADAGHLVQAALISLDPMGERDAAATGTEDLRDHFGPKVGAFIGRRAALSDIAAWLAD